MRCQTDSVRLGRLGREMTVCVQRPSQDGVRHTPGAQKRLASWGGVRGRRAWKGSLEKYAEFWTHGWVLRAPFVARCYVDGESNSQICTVTQPAGSPGKTFMQGQLLPDSGGPFLFPSTSSTYQS